MPQPYVCQKLERTAHQRGWVLLSVNNIQRVKPVVSTPGACRSADPKAKSRLTGRGLQRPLTPVMPAQAPGVEAMGEGPTGDKPSGPRAHLVGRREGLQFSHILWNSPEVRNHPGTRQTHLSIQAQTPRAFPGSTWGFALSATFRRLYLDRKYVFQFPLVAYSLVNCLQRKAVLPALLTPLASRSCHAPRPRPKQTRKAVTLPSGTDRGPHQTIALDAR